MSRDEIATITAALEIAAKVNVGAHLSSQEAGVLFALLHEVVATLEDAERMLVTLALAGRFVTTDVPALTRVRALLARLKREEAPK